ncbi:MAG TPA: pilus assembly protein TadG-related protein [Sphingobium sp.]
MSKQHGVSKGVLARLARNEAGNVFAMTAAAIFPIIGLVGGAVDMSRIYAVRARLQSACDSGALAGRRVMGVGRWSDNSGRANTIATQTFDLNFPSASFGSENVTRTFVEVDGTVTGTAYAEIPMTLMRVFGVTRKNVTVSCEGMMRIPNTDVMFVLDNSGSMRSAIPGDSSGLTKIQGLRTAIRCFYEALARQNILEVSPADCGATSDPIGGTSSQVQLRFGFVNYDHMVNVGKLLPQNYMADNWSYQSRVATTATAYAWNTQTPDPTTWANWPSPPATYGTTTGFGTFSNVSGSAYTLSDGVSYPQTQTGKTITTCPALNRFNGGTQILGIQESNGSPGSAAAYTVTSNDPPVYPAASQTLSTSRDRTNTISYGFRYNWANNACTLQAANPSPATYPQTQTGTSSRAITWTTYNRITSWQYKSVPFPVSQLKLANNQWASSISLPIGETPLSVTLSGSNSASWIKLVRNVDVPWQGCIEERQTFQNTDGNGADDWLNYPTSPAGALDMDIDLVPTTGTVSTQWRPALNDAVWARTATLNGSSWSGSNTISTVTSNVTASNSEIWPDNNNSFNSCVRESRKLTNYNGLNGNLDVTNFSTYVGTIVPNGNTYHDIGLLWGARLMSQQGLFSSENATTPGGAQIGQHMIFMTDGITENSGDNYDSYGIPWWDRRQFSVGASDTQLENNNNARSNALCTAIKNKGITLWVISYGTSVDTTTQNRLKACATSDTFFFSATNTTTLVSKFREIADRISSLRLTN